MLGTLRRALALLPPEMRGRWAALVPLLVLTAVLEAASAAAVFALVRVVADPAHAAAMPVVGAILRELPPIEPSGTIVLVAALVGLFFAAKNALGVFTAWAQARCLQDATAATSVALVRAYLAAPWRFHLARRSTDLVHDAHQAVDRIYRTVMATALGILTEGLVALGIVAVLLAAAAPATVVAVTVLLALSFVLVRVTRGALVRLGARFDRASAVALRRAQQVLGAVKELKILGRERGALEVYATDRRALADVGARYSGVSSIPRLVVEMVFVDGVDLRRCAPAWQRLIGYVPQSVFLVDDTLRRNVALGVPDGDIDESRVRTALRVAQLEPLVSSLPAGLDTPVRDLRLSGGERQRVGIARALYGEPRVLVFDEATSALDGATEAALADALRTLQGGVTMLLVAHRTTSVRRCDRVVMLHEGRIADTGSVDELAARSAEFRALAAMPDEP